MLYLIGLGLGDEKDVTVRGLEVIRAAERVYLEAYTSILGVDQAKLVRVLARRCLVALGCGYARVVLHFADGLAHAPPGSLLRPPTHRRRS